MPNADYLKPKEAGELLRIDLSTYYRRIHPFVLSRDIKALKIGRAVRVDRRALLAWAERNLSV